MSFEKWEYRTNGYREFMDGSQAWKCTLCGDIRHGGAPPGECPYCLAPGHTFRQVWPMKDTPAHEIKALR